MNSNPVKAERFCIHQVTLMEQCDFQQSIECFSRHGIYQTAIWHQKLVGISDSEAVQILKANGVRPVALCAAVLLSDDPGEDLTTMDSNRKMLEQAAILGANSVVVITGGLSESATDIDATRSRAEDNLAHLADHAKEIGVKLALEPLHPMVCGFRSVISTLNEANNMLDRIGAGDELGIALDTYALWWQADLKEEINRAGHRIINFHVSDWLKDTTDVRLDRGMPGDGIIDNRKIRSWVEAMGYEGPVEVEIFSKRNWWGKPADEVVKTIVERFSQYV